MRRWIPIGLIAVGLVLLWFFVIRTSERTGVHSVEPLAQSSDRSQPVLATDLESPPSATAPEERAVLASVAPPAVAGIGDGIEILVVDRDTQAPVERAELRYVTSDFDSQAHDLSPSKVSDELLRTLEESAVRAVTDLNGRTLLPRPIRRALVMARAEDRLGLAALSPDDLSPVLLELSTDASITVQVRDVTNAPVAGVPVGIYPADDRYLGSKSSGVTAKPDGLVTLLHVGLLLESNDFRDLAVSISGLFSPSVQETLDRDHLPRETVVLQLPPHGELEVVLRRSDGSLDASPTPVHIAITSGDPTSANAIVVGAPLVEVVGGRHVFPLVMLGAQFVVSARGGGQSDAVAQAPGPTVPGERVSITLVTDVPQSSPWIAARIVDGTGAVFSGAWLSTTLCGATPPLCSRRDGYESDAFGRLTVSVRDKRVGREPLQLFVEHAEVQPPRGILLTGSKWLPQELANGITDLGDIVLSAPPVVASGTVLDDENRAIPGARVCVGPAQSWVEGVRVPRVETRTDESGQFELRGESTANELAVAASKQGYCEASVEFATGRTDIVLRLSQAGGIAGRLLLPTGVNRYDITIACKRGDTDKKRRWGVQGASGAFRLVDLEPGVYSLEILLANEQTSLLRVEGLHVEGGVTLEDRRLNPVDLTLAIHSHELRVRDANGRPVVDIDLLWRKPGDLSGTNYGGTWTGATQRATRILSIFDALDIDVGASGMRAVRLRNVGERADVVMRRAVRVTLTLDDTSPMPPAPLVVQPVLVLEDQKQWWGDAFTLERKSTLAPESIGRCEVRFLLLDTDAKRSKAWVVTSTPQWITIDDQPESQSFNVKYSPQELERAMAE